MNQAVLQAIGNYVPREHISLLEPMSKHTSFRIGGPADCFVELENTKQLIGVSQYLKQAGIPFFVLGNGSNLLVSDDGYRGVILHIGQYMSKIEVDDCTIRAQAGASMAQIARAAWENGLTGLEFASGIPGTVGGGVVMNAGAYGGELCQVVVRVNVVNRDGECMELDRETMEFGYRTSVIKNHPFIVTDVVFCLQRGDRQQIRKTMDDLARKRREKQPLEFPSAGSTFKRPEGYFAGKLIMDAGLRGYQCGGARVSEKHCGFIINTGNATAQDVCDVICDVQEKVREKFHVDLETEILFLGRELKNI